MLVHLTIAETALEKKIDISPRMSDIDRMPIRGDLCATTAGRPGT